MTELMLREIDKNSRKEICLDMNANMGMINDEIELQPENLCFT